MGFCGLTGGEGPHWEWRSLFLPPGLRALRHVISQQTGAPSDHITLRVGHSSDGGGASAAARVNATTSLTARMLTVSLAHARRTLARVDAPDFLGAVAREASRLVGAHVTAQVTTGVAAAQLKRSRQQQQRQQQWLQTQQQQQQQQQQQLQRKPTEKWTVGRRTRSTCRGVAVGTLVLALLFLCYMALSSGRSSAPPGAEDVKQGVAMREHAHGAEEAALLLSDSVSRRRAEQAACVAAVHAEKAAAAESAQQRLQEWRETEETWDADEDVVASLDGRFLSA